MQDIAAEIGRSPLMSGLAHDEVAAVARLVELEEYASGATILCEGETDPALRIVIRGTCEVVQGNNGKPGVRLAELHAGDVCGEMSFLKPLAHAATLRALERVELVRLSPEAFATLRAQHPQAACTLIANLAALLAERLRQMDSRVAQLIAESEHRKDEWEDFRHRLFASGEFA